MPCKQMQTLGRGGGGALGPNVGTTWGEGLTKLHNPILVRAAVSDDQGAAGTG